MDGDEVIGLGVLGKGQGSGRLRIVAKEQKMKLSAKTAKKVARQHGGRGGTVSGLTSTLAFTPVQGFEVRGSSVHYCVFGSCLRFLLTVYVNDSPMPLRS